MVGLSTPWHCVRVTGSMRDDGGLAGLREFQWDFILKGGSDFRG